MQQYRVNYVLLVVLFVLGVVASGAAYGLWRFQMKRHASVLLDASNEAEEEGNIRTQVQYLSSYCSFRPQDIEARVKLANAYADLSEQDDVEFDELGRALRVLEESVRKMPDETELQTRLVKLYGRVGRTRDSLDHLGYMLDKDPDNGELLVLKTQYLFQERSDEEAIKVAYDIIGYDEEADEFDTKKAKSPDNVDTYAAVASYLRRQRDTQDLADRIIDQMIEANPDSAKAYLMRGQYFTAFDDKERGEEDFQKAYELDPKNPEVLLAAAQVASDNNEDDKARKYLEAGQAEFPEDNRFYQAQALLEMKKEDYEAAMAHVDEGLNAIKGRKAQLLIVFKSDLELRVKDLDGLRETIDKMRELNFRPQYIDWTEARILLSEGKWYEASEALSRLRADAVGLGDLATQVNLQLAYCYEQLGRNELARDTYTLVLQQNPDNPLATAGRQRVMNLLGQQASSAGADAEEQSWQQLVVEQMSKPKEEQNWEEIDKQIQKSIAERKLDEVTQKLMWANLYVMRDDLVKARQILQEVHKLVPEDNKQQRQLIQRLAIQIVLKDPEQGPEKALTLMDRAIEQFGDEPALRIDKAGILVNQRGENLPQQLAALTEGIDGWTDAQKIALWDGLATKYLSVGMSNEAKECWKNIADLQPENLPTRRMLFLLALDTNDDVGMQEAQEKILEVVKDKSDSLWQFTEARRLLSLYRRGRLGKESLPEIRLLIQKAMEQRPEWHDLYLAEAELELAEGNQGAALEDYAKAEKLGPVTPSARIQHIQLLLRHGQFNQAKLQVDKLPEESRVRLLGQAYANILLNTGDVKGSLDAARELLKVDPENAANHLWFGQLLIRAVESGNMPITDFPEMLSQANDAAERCVELAPESADAWTSLLTIRALSKDKESAEETLRDAQLALGDDLLLMYLGRGYEVLGRWFDAENMYTTALEGRPDDYRVMETMARFYLGQGYPLTDGPARATPLINRILRAGAEGKLPPNSPSLFWARRTAAKILAETHLYPDLRNAERLLSSNAENGILPREDRLSMARLLAVRPEPVSRLKAVQLLEAVKQEERLAPGDQLNLGRLYYGLNNWPKCRDQMLEAISLYPEWTAPRKSYVRMLVDRGSPRELEEADIQVRKIIELDEEDMEAIELTVRLMTKLNRTSFARRNLLKIIPKVDSPKELTTDQAKEFELIAQLLVGLEDYDEAEKIYRLLWAYQEHRVLDLADFLGRYRNAEQCFELLQEVYKPDRTIDIVRIALGTARLHRDTAGDKYDALMQQWLDRALRENPDSLKLLVLQGELYDLQQRYEDAVATYQKLLANEDLKGQDRAIVLNNLSYMAALLGDKVHTEEDPLELVQEAVDLLGPTAAILDTRAVVNTSKGNYAQAIEDLELSLADEPSTVKYFHKVVAHLGAGENQAALQAWDKAVELGLSIDELDRMERARFDAIKAKIDELRPQTAIPIVPAGENPAQPELQPQSTTPTKTEPLSAAG